MAENVVLPEALEKSRGFTQRAMAAVLNGQLEALRLRQQYIGPEHILLGLIKPCEQVLALDILGRLGVEPGGIREAVLARAERGSAPFDLELVKQGKLTPAAERVLNYAREEARQLGCPHVSTLYLLLGLLLEDGLASQVLRELGVRAELVRNIIAVNPLA